MACIINELKKSKNYATKTEEENLQAFSLEADGLISIAIGGSGRGYVENKGKFVSVFICAPTRKLKTMITRGWI